MNTTSKLIIIVNDIKPYGREVVNLIGAPKNSTARFRYQSKYIPSITTYSTTLQHRMGVIAIRSFEKGSFFPVRRFQVCRVLVVGEIIYLEALLLSMPAFSTGQHLEKQLNSFNSAIEKAIGDYENPTNGDLLNLVFLEDGGVFRLLEKWDEEGELDEVGSWGISVELLAERYALRTFDFFRVVRLLDESGNPVKYQSKQGSRGFGVTPGRKTELQVIQRTFTNKIGDSSLPSARYLELTSPNDDLWIHEKRKPLLGKYDLLRFHIQPSLGRSSRHFQLFLRVAEEGNSSLTPSLEISLMAKVSLLKYLWIGLALLAFVGCLAVFLVPNIGVSLFSSWIIVPADSIEKAAIVGLIVTGNFFGFSLRDIVKQTELS